MKPVILHLISSSGYFGAENVVVSLAEEQKNMGIETCVGVLRDRRFPHTEVADEAGRRGIKTEQFDCSGRFDLGLIMSIRRYIRENNINILHSHGYKSNFYVLVSSIFLRVKRVSTCHNWTRDDYKVRFYEFIDRFVLNKFNRVIAVSDILKKEMIRLGVRKKRIATINNGLDVKRFLPINDKSKKQLLKNSLRISEGSPVVGAVGRLTHDKNHAGLIRSAINVVKKINNVVFLIVGDGPLMSVLVEDVRKSGLENNVIFTGIVNDIQGILSIIDVFVMSSVNEGMPMALLEAMAAEKPVIASDVGGIPGLVKDHETGILISPKDTESMTEAILLILTKKQKAVEMGRNARRMVEQEFSALHMAEKYSNEYSEVLKN